MQHFADLSLMHTSYWQWSNRSIKRVGRIENAQFNNGIGGPVSDTDSFIAEVNEEVRREQLYGYLRKYGWIAVVAVLGSSDRRPFSKSLALAKRPALKLQVTRFLRR